MASRTQLAAIDIAQDIANMRKLDTWMSQQPESRGEWLSPTMSERYSKIDFDSPAYWYLKSKNAKPSKRPIYLTKYHDDMAAFTRGEEKEGGMMSGPAPLAGPAPAPPPGPAPQPAGVSGGSALINPAPLNNALIPPGQNQGSQLRGRLMAKLRSATGVAPGVVPSATTINMTGKLNHKGGMVATAAAGQEKQGGWKQNIGKWMSGLDPTAQTAIGGGLLGGATGLVTGGLSSLAADPDEEEQEGPLSRMGRHAGIGALLGGGLGAAASEGTRHLARNLAHKKVPEAVPADMRDDVAKGMWDAMPRQRQFALIEQELDGMTPSSLIRQGANSLGIPVEEPQEKVGVSLEDAWKELKFQMPHSLYWPDIAAGATVGAGLGGATYGARYLLGDKEKRKKLSLWNHLLGGAAIGGVAGEVTGDRARRYLANRLHPVGYNKFENSQSSGSSELTNENRLTPRSIKDVTDAAVLDVADDDAMSANLQKNHGYSPTDISPFMLKARRELLRLHLGLPVREDERIFTPIGNRDFTPSKTPEGLDSGGIAGNYPHFEISPRAFRQYAKDPVLKDMLQRVITRAQPFAAILARHGRFEDAASKTTRVQDHWDFGLTPQENKKLTDYGKELVSDPYALGQVIPMKTRLKWEDSGGIDWFGPSVEGMLNMSDDAVNNLHQFDATKADHLKILLQRYILNNVLSPTKGVVYDQQFDVSNPHKVFPKFSKDE